MELEYKNRTVIICGDIHGEFKTLVYELKRHQISNSIVIIAGDVGIGFNSPSYYDQIYDYMDHKYLDANDVVILAVRGNHDNPEYFNGDLRLDYPRFKTVKDYSTIVTDNHNILCIGGAYSIDKEDRIKSNNELISRGSSRRLWWASELPYVRADELVNGNYDVIVSHCSPSCAYPHIMNAAIIDRKIMDQVMELGSGKISKWFYGHYHDSCVEILDGIEFNLLNINELKELR